jgi:ataxia telangiectasia mutated family protein
MDQMQRRGAKMVYYHYADFANKQLRQLEGAEEYKRQRNLTKKVQAEIESLESSIQSTKSPVEKTEMTRKFTKAKLWLAADTKSLHDHESALKSFLEQSISMYAHYMEASDEHDQGIAIRFCGLWFSKFDSEIAAESIRHALQKVSTYKFLFLAHQLTARLGIRSSSEGGRRNQRYLNQLVEAMCLQHPYHSLFQVLSASESNTKKYPLDVGGSAQDALQGRHEDAKKIVENIRSMLQRGGDEQYSRPKNFMSLMTETFRAYVEWAKFPIKHMHYKTGDWEKMPNVALKQWTWNKKPRTTPENPLPLPVVTVEVPIDITGQYLNITTIHYFEQDFTVAGGVNTPKITVCMDSAGKSHKQLVCRNIDNIKHHYN